jgi:hypothetical protein
MAGWRCAPRVRHFDLDYRQSVGDQLSEARQESQNIDAIPLAFHRFAMSMNHVRVLIRPGIGGLFRFPENL